MTVPVLGFGTASVLGRHGRRKSERAIRAAYQKGIRHFDTARSYGWGGAEEVLGAVLAAYPRADITIVTKCGLVPIRQSRMLSLAKAVARQFMAWAPMFSGQVRRLASSRSVQPMRTYDLETLERSVRESLTKLRTPYVDLLLLHNFEAGKPGLDDVSRWMRGLQDEGVIRRYGYSVEGGLLAGLEWLERLGLLEDAIIQTPLADELMKLPTRFRHVEFIVHSPFRYLEAEAARAPGTSFADVLKRLADTLDCRAVICSMFSEAHQDQNIAAAAGGFGPAGPMGAGGPRQAQGVSP